MNLKLTLPSCKENILSIAIILIFCVLTSVFIGFRLEHALLVIVFSLLFFVNGNLRKLAVGLIPFIIFGISYDWMRIFPNYNVNTVDTEALYNFEKYLFGINNNGENIIPCEYFVQHSNVVFDLLTGIFYLGWVPVPIFFAFYLYFKKKKDVFLRFSLVFLFVNLIGFAGYYIHPAAPPWYVMEYGFEPIFGTPGNMAGLSRFDDLIAIPVYASIYGRNSNIFAAVPSLHSAYLLITLFYALKGKCNITITLFIAIFMVGIWFTAVYTAHHYIVDVILGIICAFTGIFLFEYTLKKMPFFKALFKKYLHYIV